MNLSNKLTVLIPTYNRYDRVVRLLHYLNSLQPTFQIYILDSSSDLFDGPELENMIGRSGLNYFRFPPSIQPLQKIRQGLEKVTTPYTVIWADDDFMVPKTFEAGMPFLDQNRDFAFIHGHASIFQMKDNYSCSLDSFSYYHQRDILGSTATDRMLDHLKHYTCIFYSLYRSEVLKRAVQLCCEYQFSFHFDEIVPSCIAVIHGKGKKINRLYLVRERLEKTGTVWIKDTKGTADYFDWVTSPVFAKDCQKMIEVLGKEVSEVDRISMDEAERIAKQNFWRFIADRLKKKCPVPCYSQSKIRQKLKQIKALHSLWIYLRSFSWREADRFLLPALKRKSSPYHQDFQQIYRWLKP